MSKFMFLESEIISEACHLRWKARVLNPDDLSVWNSKRKERLKESTKIERV